MAESSQCGCGRQAKAGVLQSRPAGGVVYSAYLGHWKGIDDDSHRFCSTRYIGTLNAPQMSISGQGRYMYLDLELGIVNKTSMDDERRDVGYIIRDTGHLNGCRSRRRAVTQLSSPVSLGP